MTTNKILTTIITFYITLSGYQQNPNYHHDIFVSAQ